jgi:hypothetical protein
MGSYVASRHKLWRTITSLEAEMRTLGPIVEEARSDLPALPYSEVCEVGETKVPRMNFLYVKYQWAACVLRTESWSAITVKDAPEEILGGLTIAARVAASSREAIGWWEAMVAPKAELAKRLEFAIFEYGTSRLTRVIRTPTRAIGLATPVRSQRKRDIIIEIDGGTRMLVWQFVPHGQPLDEEFLIDWAMKIQY